MWESWAVLAGSAFFEVDIVYTQNYSLYLLLPCILTILNPKALTV
jgi:hypothetical protein